MGVLLSLLAVLPLRTDGKMWVWQSMGAMDLSAGHISVLETYFRGAMYCKFWDTGGFSVWGMGGVTAIYAKTTYHSYVTWGHSISGVQNLVLGVMLRFPTTLWRAALWIDHHPCIAFSDCLDGQLTDTGDGLLISVDLDTIPEMWFDWLGVDALVVYPSRGNSFLDDPPDIYRFRVGAFFSPGNVQPGVELQQWLVLSGFGRDEMMLQVRPMIRVRDERGRFFMDVWYGAWQEYLDLGFLVWETPSKPGPWLKGLTLEMGWAL